MRRRVEERIISKTKYLKHVIRTVANFRDNGETSGLIKINSSVIKLPSGGQIIPYFRNSSGKWKVVMVNQYRVPIKTETIEGAGGRINKGEAVKKAMARELSEETGIKIKPEIITIVFNEYALPSLVDASVFGGVVRINAHMVVDKKKQNSGNGERTQVRIFDLINFLRKRDKKTIKIDLFTSRLIDEIAKVVGLLVKKY